MSENKAIKNNRQFLFEWSILNSVGWIIGILSIWFIRTSNIEAINHDRFSVWQATLGWLLLGTSIGMFQWLKLRRFKINFFMWVFVTALGLFFLEPLSRGMESLLNDWQIVPQGRVDLGEFIGNIDVGKNIAILFGGVTILIDGFITSGLQAIIIRRAIPKPVLWVKANMLGLLLLAVIISLAYFFKRIVLTTIYSGAWFLESSELGFLYVIADIAIFLLPVLIAIGFSAMISLPTGKLLIKLLKTEPNI
jgi:hypothetical protein